MKEPLIIQDANKAILVMQNVAKWMRKSGKPKSQWWEPENMNSDFLFKHIEPDEYYVAIIDGKPAASVILQDSERNQSWKPIDGNDPKKALYVHWLCVSREFAGKGYARLMVDFAANEARKKGFKLLRLDTNAKEKKLCDLYEGMNFQLMGVEQEDNHKTAFYQKTIKQ